MQFNSTKLIGTYAFCSFLISFVYFGNFSLKGLPVNFQYTLVSPINILGFLETAAADTFFHPEIIATTISSWARSLGYKAQ